MQHSRKFTVPNHRVSSTVHYRPFESPDSTIDGSYPENISYTPLHNNVLFQSHAPRIASHARRYGHDQEDERFTSTEQPSSTCVTGNHSMTLDDSLESHTGCEPSSSRLVGDDDDLSVPARQRQILLLRNWKWEALSIVISLGLMGAIIVTLAKYDHGTQPEWPYNININSLISVFTAVMIAQLSFILAESMYKFPSTPAPTCNISARRQDNSALTMSSHCVPAVISQLKWFWYNQPHPLQDLEHYDAASRGIIGSMIFLCRFASQPRA